MVRVRARIVTPVICRFSLTMSDAILTFSLTRILYIYFHSSFYASAKHWILLFLPGILCNTRSMISMTVPLTVENGASPQITEHSGN